MTTIILQAVKSLVFAQSYLVAGVSLEARRPLRTTSSSILTIARMNGCSNMLTLLFTTVVQEPQRVVCALEDLLLLYPSSESTFDRFSNMNFS